MHLTDHIGGIEVHLRGGEGDTGLVHNAGTDVLTTHGRERRGEVRERERKRGGDTKTYYIEHIHVHVHARRVQMRLKKVKKCQCLEI